VFLNQLAAEFSFSTPSAPPLTYTFKQTGDYFRVPGRAPVGCKPTRSGPVHARLECKSLMGNGIGKILPATQREH